LHRIKAKALADYTAGGELRPAPKDLCIFILIISLLIFFVKGNNGRKTG
jgi:hypothetical protein